MAGSARKRKSWSRTLLAFLQRSLLADRRHSLSRGNVYVAAVAALGADFVGHFSLCRSVDARIPQTRYAGTGRPAFFHWSRLSSLQRPATTYLFWSHLLPGAVPNRDWPGAVALAPGPLSLVWPAVWQSASGAE